MFCENENGFQIEMRFSKGFDPIVCPLLCDWTTNSSLLWFLFMHTYKVSENYRFAHFQTPQFFLHTKDEMIIFVPCLVLKRSKNVGVSNQKSCSLQPCVKALKSKKDEIFDRATYPVILSKKYTVFPHIVSAAKIRFIRLLSARLRYSK